MTAEQAFWLLFIFVPLSILWFLIMVDVLRRADLLGWHKALWLLAIIFFPWIGALGYIATRPSEATLARKMRGRPAAPVPASRGPDMPRSNAPRPTAYGAAGSVRGAHSGVSSGTPRASAPQPSAPRPPAPQPSAPRPSAPWPSPPQPAAPGWDSYNGTRQQ